MPNRSETRQRKRLRYEGGALDYQQFIESQRESLRRILYMLEEAIQFTRSDATDIDPQSQRSSNLIFIDGPRGSGKTCILNTLIRYSTASPNDADFREVFESDPPPQKGAKIERRWRALERVRQHVVWLHGVDVDPLPCDFNLLSALMVRIKQAILVRTRSDKPLGLSPLARLSASSTRGQASSSLGNETGILQEVENLQADAALAWQSGLLNRPGEFTPEQFASDSARLADAYLHFDLKFRKVLDNVAQQFFTPETLFVLPFDDTDLSPSTGLAVLKLLRTLNSRRLMTIAMGDIEQFELISSLELFRTLGFEEQLTEHSLLPVSHSAIRTRVSAISATNLRKLIPMDQRVRIRPWTAEESLGFRPKDATQTLGDLLARIPVCMDEHIQHNLRLRQEVLEGTPQLQFLYFPVQHVVVPKVDITSDTQIPSDGSTQRPTGAEILKRFVEKLKERSEGLPKNGVEYFGRHWLSSSPRRIADQWFAARRIADYINRLQERDPDIVRLREDAKSTTFDKGNWERHFREFWKLTLDTLQRLCRQALMEEPMLSCEDRALIEQCFSEHSGHIDWNRFPVTLRPNFAARPSIRKHAEWDREAKSSKYPIHSGVTLELQFNEPLEWTVEKVSRQALEKNVQKAHQERRAFFDHYDDESLTRDTASLLVFYQDLLQFSQKGMLFPPDFTDMSVYGGLPWAITHWYSSPQLACQLYWPAPRCISVLGLDLFRACWQEVVKPKDQDSAASKEKGAGIGESGFVWAWIAAGNAAVGSLTTLKQSWDKLKQLRHDAGDWKGVRDDLGQLAGVVNDPGGKGNHMPTTSIREWLRNVACLLMPEYGLDPRIRKAVLFSEDSEKHPLLTFLENERRAIRDMRARNLATLIFHGLPALAERLRICDFNLAGPLALASLDQQRCLHAFKWLVAHNPKVVAICRKGTKELDVRRQAENDAWASVQPAVRDVCRTHFSGRAELTERAIESWADYTPSASINPRLDEYHFDQWGLVPSVELINDLGQLQFGRKTWREKFRYFRNLGTVTV